MTLTRFLTSTTIILLTSAILGVVAAALFTPNNSTVGLQMAVYKAGHLGALAIWLLFVPNHELNRYSSKVETALRRIFRGRHATRIAKQ